MAEIKELKDKEGNGATFYPKTHEDAVIDDNGTPLSTKLGSIITFIYH